MEFTKNYRKIISDPLQSVESSATSSRSILAMGMLLERLLLMLLGNTFALGSDDFHTFIWMQNHLNAHSSGCTHLVATNGRRTHYQVLD